MTGCSCTTNRRAGQRRDRARVVGGRRHRLPVPLPYWLGFEMRRPPSQGPYIAQNQVLAHETPGAVLSFSPRITCILFTLDLVNCPRDTGTCAGPDLCPAMGTTSLLLTARPGHLSLSVGAAAPGRDPVSPTAPGSLRGVQPQWEDTGAPPQVRVPLRLPGESRNLGRTSDSLRSLSRGTLQNRTSLFSSIWCLSLRTADRPRTSCQIVVGEEHSALSMAWWVHG